MSDRDARYARRKQAERDALGVERVKAEMIEHVDAIGDLADAIVGVHRDRLYGLIDRIEAVAPEGDDEPDTIEEVDEELRAFGVDPDAAAHRLASVAMRALHMTSPNQALVSEILAVAAALDMTPAELAQNTFRRHSGVSPECWDAAQHLFLQMEAKRGEAFATPDEASALLGVAGL